MKGIIIGGGIGGLTTSVALNQKQISTTVYEQASQISEVGAGIWVASNALTVYEKLGLAEEIIRSGRQLEEINVMDTSGKILSTVGLKDIREKFKYGTISIHRAVLHNLLLKHIPSGSVITGKRFTHYTQNETSVTAHFSDGSYAEADFIICADGIKSPGRNQISPQTPLRYSGQTCWRFVTEFKQNDAEKGKMYEIWGNAKGLRAAYSYLDENHVYCYITVCTQAGGKDDIKTLKQDLLNICEPFQPFIKELIKSVAPEKIIRSDIFDFNPISNWQDKKVILLGDAAHATTPNLGQGACQAIEDAYVIALCMDKFKNIEEAFQNYFKLRKDKSAFITNTSRQLGQATNTSGITKSIIKFMMRNVPSFISQKQFDKIYRVDYNV